jgi:DNA-binding SARP family transcriptional activator
VPHHHLLTLGLPVLLTAAGEQVRFRTRKHFALLIRLAVEAGRKFTRDYLTDLLWADAPTRLASHSLAQALSVLRAKIGREHIHIQHAGVTLAEDAVEADVRRLDQCDVEIRGRFLDGLEITGARSFEDWKDGMRARLMPRLRDCLVKQMDAGRRIGDFGTVEQRAQVLQDLDPISEDAVRGLMEARAYVGDRVNALKAFARYEAQLGDELQAKPGADLVRMVELLREGRRSIMRAPAVGEPEAPLLQRRFEPEMLIGREREFSGLYDAWIDARQREPRIVVLTGDPGVGKTTLTNAFASACQMEGAVVARTQAYDAERELPFAVLAELVRQLALQKAIGGAEPEALSELSRVCPEIFHVFPGVPKPIEWTPDVTPLRLADGFLKAVAAAAEESPVVLIVDDIHAADNASSAILHMVARKVAGLRLLLVLTARSAELRASGAPAALTSDSSIDAMRGLELEVLPPEAATQLVSRLAAAAVPEHGEAPIDRILQASNGNPLALELLTREWADHGPGSLLHDLEALNTQPVASIGIPRAISTVFERQVRRLDATTRAALDLAAVLGRRLASLDFYRVVELKAGEAAEALSRLKDEGLLREVRGDLEFRNELIRGQAYYAITAKVRQQLHHRVAELFQSKPRGDEDASDMETAWHFLRGGDVGGAVRFALQGAESAIKDGAPTEGERLLTAIRHEDLEPESRRRLQFLLARALIDQSKADEVKPLFGSLLADETLSLVDRAVVSRMQADVEYLLNTRAGGNQREAADSALETASRAGDTEILAQALFCFARTAAELGDGSRNLKAFKLLEDLLRTQEVKKSPTALTALGLCQLIAFTPSEAARSFMSAIELLQCSKNLVPQSIALNGLGIAKYRLCESGLAVQAFNSALSLSKRIGDDSRASIISGNLAGLHTLRGEYALAVRVGKEGVTLGQRALNQPFLVGTLLNLAEAHLLADETPSGLRMIAAADEWMEEKRTWWANVEYLLQRSSLALVLGNKAHAIDLLDSLETEVAGKENLISNAGLFTKLSSYRHAHISGAKNARDLVHRAGKRFQTCEPLFYLDVVTIRAWLERQSSGEYTPETEKDLQLFAEYQLPGKRAIAQLQGLLI